MTLNALELVRKIRSGEISAPDGIMAISTLRDEIRRRAAMKEGTMANSSLEEGLKVVLIQIMSGVLSLKPPEIDPDDNLSEYGFDSIALTEFAGRIVRRYPFMKLEPSIFLELPTLSKLASLLGSKYKTELLNAMETTNPAEKLPAEQLRIEVGPEKAVVTNAPKKAPLTRPQAEVKDTDIAIIGIAGRFPGAENPAELWKNVVQEKSMLSKVPAERWDWRAYFGDPQKEGKTDCCYGAFLDDVARFDALHFGISPAEAELLDPQHRILLEVAWEAVENAGYRKSALHNRRIGVFVGVEKQDYKELINKSRFELDPYTNAGNTHSMLANRISHFFNWHGPSVALDTACSSSLAAIGQACDLLRSGRIEMALAGGINLLLTPWIFVVNRKLGMLTNEPVIRSFDRSASGHLNGEGAGLVVLKPLSRAIADNDIIYGVIRGISVQHGGRGVFLTAPNPAGHRAVIEDALADAGLESKDIDYIEAQGTADQVSDRVELKTYQAVFGGSRAQPVKIGTVKGNLGHLGAASGVTAIIKAVLSIRNNKLPRVLNLDRLNWGDDEGRFLCEVLSCTQEWPRRSNGSVSVPRRAAIHNFGYGGVNAHAILEEYLAPAISAEIGLAGPAVVPLSARTQEQLKQYAENLRSFIHDRQYRHYGISELPLSALAYTLQVGREPMDYRTAIVASSLPELEQSLTSLCRGDSSLPLVFSGTIHAQNDLRHTSQAARDELRLRGRLSVPMAGELAKAWAEGEEFDWGEFYGETKPQRVPLPTYPFARERYWVPLASDVPSTDSDCAQRSSISMQREESIGHHSNQALEMLVTRDLKQQVCSLLKLKQGQIDERKNLVEFGFSSRTLTQFAQNLSGLFGIDLLPVVFFSYSAIAQLTPYLVQGHRPALESFYKLKTEAVASEKQSTQLSTPEATDKPEQSSGTSNPSAGVSPNADEPIAVIGMSGRFPGAESTSELWSILAAGKSMISEIPKDRWDWRDYYRGPGDASNEISTNRGGFINGVAEFDPIFFDLSPREAELIDPRQRLLLQEAWRAFEDAGYAGPRLRGTSCGVFIGVEEGEYEKLTGDDGLLTGNHNGILASRISYLLDLKGPSLAINTACSSGLVAVHLACQSLQRGEAEMALAGAVHLLLFPGIYQQLTRMGMLSESGQCFTFDERSDGIVPGEAVAVLLLKRLSSAIEDGDNIYGVIKGGGLNYKGRTNGMTAPGGLSQRRLIEETYRKYGVQAGNIDYVAAHGTGTKLGDPVEVAALTEAFRASTAKIGHCALGSLKANLGHTFAASGIVSMIAALLGMKHNTIPASLNCEKANEFLSLSASPFYINTTPVQWIPQPGKKRLAAVSAFGISGTNAHVVLEEHAAPVPHESGMKGGNLGTRMVIVPLSARSEERLREYAGRLLGHVKSNFHGWMGDPSLADLAYTLQTGRDAMDCRVAFVVKDTNELVHSLQNLLEDSSDENYFYGRAHRDLAILQTIGSDEDMQDTIRRWMSKGKLREVATLWVSGAEIDWELFKNGDEKRISLPTYPFARRTCWFHPHKEVVYGIESTPSSHGAETQRRTVEALDPAALEEEAMWAVGTPENRTPSDRTSSAGFLQSLHSSPQESGSGRAGTPTMRLRIEVPPEKPVEEMRTGGYSRTNGAEPNLQAIERDLKIRVSEALYLDEGEVEIRKKFVDMGLNSIMGVELVNKLNQYYQFNLSATRFYDYCNIVELAKFIYAALMSRSNGEKNSFPDALPPGGKSLPGPHPATRTADSIEEQVREVLRQLSAKLLTPDDAEQLIANGFESLSAAS
jgi:polyketide synthase PksN